MRKQARGQVLRVALGALLALGPMGAAAETQGQSASRGSKMVRVVPAPAFNWFANANPSASNAEAIARTKAAIRKARGLNNGASWVCSSAGSGRGSACSQG